MKATIAITTYRRPQLLKTRTIPFALIQTFKDYEVLVVDDGSDDNTAEIVQKFMAVYPNVRYCRHDQNRGLAAARNTGAKEAAGSYVAFLDDDDVYVTEFLEMACSVLDNMPDKKLVIGKRAVINPESIEFEPLPAIMPHTLYTTLDDGFLMRKQVFEEIQYDETLFTNEDADFGIQFMRKYGPLSIGVVNNIFLYKYGHPVGGEGSYSSPSGRVLLGMDRFLAKNLPLYEECGNLEELEYILRMAGRLNVLGGNLAKGRGFLWRAYRTLPRKKNIKLLLASLGGVDFFRRYWQQHLKKLRTS